MRVLLVELEPRVGDIFERAFQLRGWEVHGTHEPSRACAAYREVEPDVVLLAFGSSGEDGLDALRRILVEAPEARCVCVAAPGFAALDVALALGARAVVDSPYTLDGVLDAAGRVADD